MIPLDDQTELPRAATSDIPPIPGGIRMSPRYWPAKLGFSILKLAAKLPYRVQYRLGVCLGRVALRISRKRREIVRTNLKLCFPDLSEAQIEDLVRRNFESTGIGMFEIGVCWYTPERVTQLGRVEGIEHLDAALEAGNSAILLCVHLTGLEIGGSIVGQLRKTAVMYAPNDDPVFENECRRGRGQNACELISREDIRAAVRCLKGNTPLWYAADEDTKTGRHVFVPFFGVPASMLVAVARLADVSGAPILPLTQQRLPDGQGFVATIHPRLVGLTRDDELRDATIVTRFFEEYLTRHPEDYMWSRRRFRTRPEGQRAVYAQREKRKIVSSNRYRTLVRQGEILERVDGKPRTLRTPEGHIVKFYYRSDRPALDWILSPSRDFERRIKQLQAKGDRMPYLEVDSYCPAYRCRVFKFHPPARKKSSCCSTAHRNASHLGVASRSESSESEHNFL